MRFAWAETGEELRQDRASARTRRRSPREEGVLQRLAGLPKVVQLGSSRVPPATAQARCAPRCSGCLHTFRCGLADGSPLHFPHECSSQG